MATPMAAKHRDFEQDMRDLKAAVKALAAAVARRPKFEVSAGDLTIRGGDLVVDGGDFLLLDTDGSTVFRLGPQEHGDRGVSILREDGAVAFEARRRFSNSPDQSVAMYGRNSEELVVEEELGTGFAAPFFPMTVQPFLASVGAVAAGPHGFEVATSSGSFTTTHFAEGFRQNQFVRLRIAVAASDATTAAEVRIRDAETGTNLGQFLQPAWTGVRAAGSTGYTVLEAGGSSPLYAGGEFASVRRLEVQVRRSAGAGTLSVAVPFASGSGGAPI